MEHQINRECGENSIKKVSESHLLNKRNVFVPSVQHRTYNMKFVRILHKHSTELIQENALLIITIPLHVNRKNKKIGTTIHVQTVLI